MSVHSDVPGMRVVIVGAGGQGRVAADILLSGFPGTGLSAVGFVDDAAGRIGEIVLGIPVLGTLEQLAMVPHDRIVVAIGDNAARQRVFEQLVARGERPATIRHPFSSVGHDVTIGEGTMISAGAVVTPSVHIGRGALINTGARIDHETVVGDFAHIGPGAVVGGRAHIGARVLVGLGACIMSGRRLGDDAIAGAGAVVTRDLPPGIVAIGTPARDRAAG